MARYEHEKIDPAPKQSLVRGRGKVERYNYQQIEKKWRTRWARKKAWKVDLNKAKKPYYNLMMFPYPSAEGLHVGNVYAFTSSDIHGRFERMRGNDVFEPMGFDSFGIHSENFAIKKGTHPKEQTAKNIKHFTEQLKQLGALFDWDHSVTTSDQDYYKWTQWLFVQLYKKGLAYKGKAPVDWCPSCKTVLADEQVIEGKCERCSTQVLQKELEQWFFKITKYADRLLKNLSCLPAEALGPNTKVTKEMAKAGIDWTEKTKIAQRNWIGKSEGVIEKWDVEGINLQLETFTTWPHTTYGATFHAVAPEHPVIKKLVNGTKYETGARKFIDEVVQNKIKDPTSVDKEKKGFFTGRHAINFLTKEKMPIYIANFAVMGYGTGIVKGAPAHDQRDFEFATKYKLPIKQVICGNYPEPICPILKEAYTGLGHMVGTGKFDGMPAEEAKKKIAQYSIKLGYAQKKTQYHLRDWLISRQRYWGPPIPIIYCKKCGTVPVPEKDLPVKLPEVKDFRPKGTGKSPLASVASFVKTKCPQCKGQAERETDVSDTFLDSAWYFFRYPSTRIARSGQVPFDPKITRKWLPVNMYIGGHEHAVLHLLYTRFITMTLKDMGHIGFEEPFKKFRAHGLITKEGAKMSKSKGNVVNPDEYFKKYGADTVRTYLMFIGPLSEGGDWSDKGIVGISRFFNRLWSAVIPRSHLGAPRRDLGGEALRHKTIKKVTEDLESLRYNTAIAALMEYLNALQQANNATKEQVNTLLILLSPFAPYLTEELWEKLGNKGSVHEKPWPKYNPKLLQEKQVRLVVQVNGRVRDVLEVSPGISEKEAISLALQQEKIKKWFPKGKPKNVVFVKGRLLNLVSY